MGCVLHACRFHGVGHDFQGQSRALHAAPAAGPSVLQKIFAWTVPGSGVAFNSG